MFCFQTETEKNDPKPKNKKGGIIENSDGKTQKEMEKTTEKKEH